MFSELIALVLICGVLIFLMSQVEGRACSFFRWYDAQVNECDKKIIQALLRSNNEMKNRERFFVGWVVISWLYYLSIILVLVGVMIVKK